MNKILIYNEELNPIKVSLWMELVIALSESCQAPAAQCVDVRDLWYCCLGCQTGVRAGSDPDR